MPAHLPIFLWFFLFFLVFNTASGNGTLVVTSSGPMKGKHVPAGSSTVTAYLGIPYAEPPLGKLRFQKPLPHQPWSHILEATTFGNSCLQLKMTNLPDGVFLTPNTLLSEDCLFLNIWVPHPKPSTPVPILVWIHGGGFVTGAASLDLYNGAFLAATENVIVASMNYRLGVLGFFFLPPAAPGNVGLWDQWLALKWVKENAAVFGGDPAQLTLLGHSVGAAMVGFHLLSPASQPLFARAVLQSGAPNALWAWRDPEDAKKEALMLILHLDCGNDNYSAAVSCLQGKDIQTLLLSVSLTTDGDFLLEEPRKLLETRAVQTKPILTGITADDGSINILQMFQNMTANNATPTSEQLLEGVRRSFPRGLGEDVAKAVVSTYSKPEQNRQSLAHYFSDYYFVCPFIEFAAEMAKAGSPVYAYFFNHHTASSLWPEWTGAYHGVEIPYLFGAPASLQGTNQSYTEAEVALSVRVIRYWGEFARKGNPTGSTSDGVQWPLFNATEQSFFHISTEVPQVLPLTPAHHCDFLKTHVFSAAHKNKSQEILSEQEKVGKNETRNE